MKTVAYIDDACIFGFSIRLHVTAHWETGTAKLLTGFAVIAPSHRHIIYPIVKYKINLYRLTNILKNFKLQLFTNNPVMLIIK